MDTLGKLVHEKRTKKKETVRAMAKAIKCSPGFAMSIEYAPHVAISDRLIVALSKHYKIKKSDIEKAAAARKRRSKKYYQKYQKSA